MFEHQICPECNTEDSRIEHTEHMDDMIEVVRICNECPTQWTVSFGDPYIKSTTDYADCLND